MFKLYSRLRKRDWFLTAIIVGLTILQVWCTMLIVDYIADIIQAITYLNYHNNATEFLALFDTGTMGAAAEPIKAFFQSFVQDGKIDWASLTANSQYQTILDTLAAVSPEGHLAIVSIAEAGTDAIWFNGGMMVLVAFGLAGCQIVIEIMASYITAHFATDIRTKINAKISSFSLAEINKFSTASLITRSTNDIQQVSMCTLMMLRMIFAAPVTAIWAICKIQAVSYQLTLATGVAIVLLVLVLVLIMGLVLPKFKVMQKQVDRINSLTQENLTGIRVVRAFNAEKYQEDKFQVANKDLTRTQLFTGRMLNLMSPAMMIIMNGLTMAVYWIGAYLMQNGIDKSLDYGNVSAFSSLATQIVMSFMMLLMMFILWPRASVSAKRINEVLETKNTILDPDQEKKTEAVGTVEFKDVSFRYPDAEADILEHISFKANKGDTVAFIGSTGSGKSTLVNLVTRLYDCTQGEVLIDGVNVKDLKQETLRKKIGFVPQKGVLFSGTVRSNVGFGLKGEIDKEKCDRALSIACASEFVEKMEGKEEAPIAQGGTNVSGGQRQRLCIARAVAIDPEIFVFDDSFSALDFKTDRTVRDNLAREEKDATKLIVAQRIGTIMDADLILVLQEGKVVGQGTHKELLQTCPVYRDIALSQLSKEELGL